MIDGCSRSQALRKVIIPLTLPGMGATLGFVFTAAWSELLFALMLISSDSQKTFAVGLLTFIGKFAVDWGQMMAASVLALIPGLPVLRLPATLPRHGPYRRCSQRLTRNQTMASVTISNVQKNYGAMNVLSAVDLSIADGEFVVLVGPSGCGKSTLLRMIAGLEEISAGEIRIGDRVVNDVAPKDRDIAMVFQSYALYPHMDVAENMGFSLTLRKTAKDLVMNRVGNAAKRLGLDVFLERLPRQLSGGQRQRVAMGRAIVRDPKVFLFDEPLSNLDAKLRVHMRTEIKALHQQLKTTSVYVTHDQVEAMTMADRIVVMHDGVIQQVGTPLELYDHPANLFVAGFIGSPGMNFLPAVVSRQGERSSTEEMEAERKEDC